MVAVASCALVIAGCESTQDRSAELAAQSQTLVREEGLRITRASRDVEVVDRTVIADENGAAVVAILRNRTARALVDVPVAIDVKDARGRSVFRNDNAGAERALVSLPVLGPRETIAWVHDQVQATAAPADVEVVVGEARHARAAPPRLELGRTRYEEDPVSGTTLVGRVRNPRGPEQKGLTIFAVSRRGGRVLAAGRAAVQHLRGGRAASYAVYFIGKPKGGELELAAPPTVLP